MEFMLDSGAYSAYTKGVKIDIDDYCDFIKKYENIIDHYIVLDVIGNAQKTLEAQNYMESKGLSPLPVFHQGESWDYLEHYVEKYDYICISPLSYSAGGGNMISWLDTCFADHICNSDGYPKCKVHGLGLTIVKMMLRYPWYSVDSSSWVQSSAYGNILIPKMKNGQWDWSVSPNVIEVSNRMKSINANENNYFNLPSVQKNVVDKYLLQHNIKIGVSKIIDGKEEIIEEGVSNTYQIRDRVNALYYRELEKNFKEYPWAFKIKRVKGLFV